MALYVALSQIAVFLVLPTDDDTTRVELIVTVALTSVALVLAHRIAFQISARLAQQSRTNSKRIVGAQANGGCVTTGLAVVPVALFGVNGLVVANLVLLAFVSIVGYVAGRTAGMSRLRASGYVLGVMVTVLCVVFLKALVSH